MATLRRFQDVEAWRRARALTRAIYELSGGAPFSRDYCLRDQIRRAAISVMSNIAEGFERGRDREFAHYLAIAKGSAGEVESQLQVALDLGYIKAAEFARLSLEVSRTKTMIGGLIRYLRKTETSVRRKH